MTTIIDTSSLLSFVRYYLPFDSKGVLRKFIVEQVRQGAVVVLDAVWEECGYVAQGIVVQELSELLEYVEDTTSLLPPSQRKMSNLLDENFCQRIIKNKLSEEEYLLQKQGFMKSADYKIIVKSMQPKGMFDEGCSVLTEETSASNDNKVFKKLPSILRSLNIPVSNISQFFKNNGIDAEWYIRKGQQGSDFPFMR